MRQVWCAILATVLMAFLRMISGDNMGEAISHPVMPVAAIGGHLLFLIGLLLLGGGLRAQARTVGAFILAHSVAFALVISGMPFLSSIVTELWIALSLVAVSLESTLVSVSDSGERRRLLLVTIAGVVHGFGFGGMLLEKGWVHTDLGLALIVCNTGFEIGAITMLCLAAPIVYTLARARPLVWRTVHSICTAMIAFIGAYWLVLSLLKQH